MPNNGGTLSLIADNPFPGERDNISDIAFNLLGSTPFIWKTEGLSWPHQDLAASLLHCQIGELPSRMDVFEGLSGETDCEARSEALANLTWDGARYVLTYELGLYDGQRVWVEERGQRVSGEGKKPTEIIGVITNIQAQKAAEEKALFRASFDEDTGLWNRARMRGCCAIDCLVEAL